MKENYSSEVPKGLERPGEGETTGTYSGESVPIERSGGPDNVPTQPESIPGFVRRGAEHATATGGGISTESGVSEVERASEVKAPGEVNPNDPDMAPFLVPGPSRFTEQKSSGAYSAERPQGIIYGHNTESERGNERPGQTLDNLSDLIGKTSEVDKHQKDFEVMLGHPVKTAQDLEALKRYIKTQEARQGVKDAIEKKAA
jgi:hypothetical protein